MPLLLSVEHASNCVPESLQLGITEDVLETHVAWDEGAILLAEYLATHTGAPLHRGSYSRLVADLNRSPENPEAVPENAFGVAIPGNRLSADERARRLDQFHRPYWEAVLTAVEDRLDAHQLCVHFSVHSFCPHYGVGPRDFDFGLLFDPARPAEKRLADALATALGGHGHSVRENEPYTGTADSLLQHLRKRFSDRQYIGMALELSQRLATDALDDIAKVVAAVLRNPECLRPR